MWYEKLNVEEYSLIYLRYLFSVEFSKSVFMFVLQRHTFIFSMWPITIILLNFPDCQYQDIVAKFRPHAKNKKIFVWFRSYFVLQFAIRSYLKCIENIVFYINPSQQYLLWFYAEDLHIWSSSFREGRLGAREGKCDSRQVRIMIVYLALG